MILPAPAQRYFAGFASISSLMSLDQHGIIARPVPLSPVFEFASVGRYDERQFYDIEKCRFSAWHPTVSLADMGGSGQNTVRA